jgi:hypothetical protein
MRKLILSAAALTFAVPALALALSAPASAAPSVVSKAGVSSLSTSFAACGRSGPNIQNGHVADAAFTGAANIRTGSSTACAAVGVMQPTDDAVYFCYTGGTDGTWTYLRNVRTGVQGWVKDSLLRGNGSNSYCGF